MFASLILSAWLAAQVETITVDGPSLVEIKVAAAESADVSFEFRKPLTTRSKVYALRDGSTVMLFHASGSVGEYVVSSDVIDWDQRERTKTTWVVKVGGTKPPKPDPDDDNNPSPTPDNVPNKYGIGPAVYQSVMSLSDRSKSQSVTKLIADIEQSLSGFRLTSASALDLLERELRSNAPGWSAVVKAIRESVAKAGQVHGSGTVQMMNYLREARLAIALASS